MTACPQWRRGSRSTWRQPAAKPRRRLLRRCPTTTRTARRPPRRRACGPSDSSPPRAGRHPWRLSRCTTRLSRWARRRRTSRTSRRSGRGGSSNVRLPSRRGRSARAARLPRVAGSRHSRGLADADQPATGASSSRRSVQHAKPFRGKIRLSDDGAGATHERVSTASNPSEWRAAAVGGAHARDGRLCGTVASG